MKNSLKSTLLASTALLLIASSAFAADLKLGSKDGPSAFESAGGINWTGPYIGAHAGYSYGESDVTDTNGGVPAGPFGYSSEGVFGGGTVGYNRQFSNIVIGIEADFGYLNLEGDTKIASSTPAYHQDLTQEGGLYGVAAARLGLSFGRALIYAKGGVVYFDGEAAQTTTKPGFITNTEDHATGWAYGGGVEYALSQHWSLKAEYLRFDFGTQDGGQTSVGSGFNFRNETDLTVDTAKVGVNYRF